jgi:hypothetical protein
MKNEAMIPYIKPTKALKNNSEITDIDYKTMYF